MKLISSFKHNFCNTNFKKIATHSLTQKEILQIMNTGKMKKNKEDYDPNKMSMYNQIQKV